MRSIIRAEREIKKKPLHGFDTQPAFQNQGQLPVAVDQSKSSILDSPGQGGEGLPFSGIQLSHVPPAERVEGDQHPERIDILQ